MAYPTRAAAPGEGRSDLPETGSAGAPEAVRYFAGRCRTVSERPTVAGGMDVPSPDDGREVDDVSGTITLPERSTPVGFTNEKPWCLTSGISGERSESAACRG